MNPHDRRFDGIARRLILHAARKAPPALSERLEEEWLADLGARAGAVSRLRFALGCCWATRVIALEFGAPVRAAAAAGHKATVVDDAGFRPSFSRRTPVILLIVGLHALVIGVLATTIVAPKVLKASPPPRIDVSFLPRPAPPPPPPPADPTFTHIQPDFDTPLIPLVRPEPTVAAEAPVTQAPPVKPTGPTLPKPVNRVMGGPGAGFPNTDDFYPETARLFGEQGVTTVGVCVDGAGRLTGKPTIDESSGSARLDGGALKLAQAGSGHYRATTEDGRPVSACYGLRVRFHLRN